MSRPTVLVVGCASSTPHGRDQMRRLSAQARRRGIALVGADTPRNLAAMDPGLVDELVAFDVPQPARAREWATGRGGIDAVLTFREMCVESVAALADELGVAGNDQSVVRTIRAKDLCRRKLRESGFAQPDCRVVRSRDEAEALMADTGPGPWIVKPRSGMGSTGVSLVESRAMLAEAIDRISGEAPFLIETYVPGREFSAEGVMLGGEPRVLALTAKTTGAGFVETGHRMPADLDESTAVRAQEQVERALCAVGLSRGIFHVEFWADGDSIVLGEVHARPGGDFIHAMVEHVRPGLELYGLLIDDLLGNPAPALPEPSRAAGVEYLVLDPGEVRSVEGWEQVSRAPEVLAAELSVRPGDHITSVRGSADRHGVLVFGANTSSEVDKLAIRAKKALRIDITRPSEHGLPIEPR